MPCRGTMIMERLVFNLEEIPPEGLTFQLDTDPSTYLIEGVAVKNPPGLSGWLGLRKRGSEIEVEGEIGAVLKVQCGRCLAVTECPTGGKFFTRMVPPREDAPQEEMELQRGELDVEFLEGHEIDVRRIIAEQVYLNVPIKPLCGKDCRGLCSRCGQDLNQGDCGHDEKPADPRWDALKTLKETDPGGD